MAIIIFIFGLIVGSFLNCVIYRMETGGSFLKGRSFCPHCKHKLGFWDLMPVLSFIWLRGRCRYCQKPISIQYPLVEIATGIIFLLIFNFQFSISNEFPISNFQNLLAIGYWLLIIGSLIVIFVYDLKHYIIPDKVIYPAIAIAGIFNFQFSIFISAFGAAIFFLTIVLISRGKWMGVGDIKLAFLMGLLLGYPDILVALFLAFLIGAIMGLGLIILGKKTIKSEVPFGPFLVVGTFIALFWGKEIINWYVQSFHIN
ncbi:MAG: prepilin peptidase [Candidatus Nealsonbacteria bacterium]|nr:prepilin peptidase [Candidatus Nealsonbacteria bacterium]